MGEHTSISWTDHTFNPWIGCTRVSPGCDHCYAEAMDARWRKGAHWGKGAPRQLMSKSYWNEPLAWDRQAAREGRKHLVFCASMADVMDDEAPEGQRARLWNLIDATPNLIWQLLTKRPHRYERYLPAEFKFNNVWYLATAENQEFFDVRYPILRELVINRGGIAGISYEPALGPLSIIQSPLSGFYYNIRPDWIIFGGESGGNRRECKREWADNLLREIREVSPETKLFVKQFGGRTPAIGKSLIPAELMIQEFPVNSGSLTVSY